jgi:pyruvate formate lyase activating enzyme
LQARIVLRKTSLVDYPGKVAAVFFFPRCSLRCPWCHNRELVLETGGEELTGIDEGLALIAKRRAVLGGVVLSGGEPAAREDLPELVALIKTRGLPVKLDTNGMHPLMLEKLFSTKETRPDYIALDLKLAPSRYGELAPAHSAGSYGEKLKTSAVLIRDSGIAHEYRSLALPGEFFGLADVEALASLVDDAPWYFRTFSAGNCLDPSWNTVEAPGVSVAEALASHARQMGKNGICP